MSELALAMFAASRDMHATDRESRTARFAAFVASFDDAAELRRLAEARLPLDRPLRPGVPGAAEGDPRPTAGALPARRCRRELSAAPAVAVVGARACSDYGAHVARSLVARARGRRSRRDLGARPRHRRLGPPRLPRGGRRDRRRARLRHRSRLPARARVARTRDRRARPARRRVPAGCRAGAVAVPGPQPDRRRPRARHRRRRGARAERRADHRRPRARGGARGARRPRRDHIGALAGRERAAPPRRDAR